MAFLTLLRKRLLGLLLVVFGVSLITFAISHLIPGDPARLIAGDRASDALVAGIRHQLGLDLPLYQQYGRYLMDLVQETWEPRYAPAVPCWKTCRRSSRQHWSWRW